MAKAIPAAIQRFIEGIQTGNWDGMEGHYTPDVFYDASVPGWRYQYEGASRILDEMKNEWTGKHPWQIIDLYISPTDEGAVVTLELRGLCPGDRDHEPHEEGCRLANLFRLEDGRISEHRFYCCGNWDEETLRHIESEAPKVRRSVQIS